MCRFEIAKVNINLLCRSPHHCVIVYQVTMATTGPTWLMSFCLEQRTLRKQQLTSTQRAGLSRPGTCTGFLSGGGRGGNLPPLERSVPPLESVRLKSFWSIILIFLI